MSTNLRLLSILIAMSLFLFAGVMGYQVYRVERDYKTTFLAEKTAFGEQVARIALSGMQTSDYFGIARLGNELYKPEAMLYLAITDETGQLVHFRSDGDMDKIRSARSGIAQGAAQEDLGLLGNRVALVHAPILDDAGKTWGSVEIAYFWAPVQRLLRRQTLAFTFFFLAFVSIWGAVLSFSARSILGPLDRFVRDLGKIQSEWPVSLEEFNARLVPAKATSDVNVLLNVLRTSLVKLLEYQENQLKEAEFAALGKLAAQVAHDIRSPLAAMDSVISSTAQVPEEKRLIIRSAAGRIRDIANNLIEEYRQLPGKAISRTDGDIRRPTPGGPVESRLLSNLLDSLITEKRMQFRSRVGIQIDGQRDAASYGLFAILPPADFMRVVSNLVNNAVDAIGESGTVVIRLSSADRQAVLKISDDGRGIPPEILTRLGQRGETHGKFGGSGLGLYHAKASVEAWNGSLELQSAPGKGTTVTIRLPQAQPPDWFVSVLELDARRPVVVLDDDSSIHQVWRGRFDSLRPMGQPLKILHFSTPAELRDWVKADAKRARDAVYLMDYELLGHADTGLTLISELGLGERSILVTSRFEEKAILDGCLRLKARLIPKGLAGFVPIRVRPATGVGARLDAVLIDDDALVRMNWSTAARRAGKSLKVYSDAASFLAESDAGAIPMDTPIYIDSNLADGVKGEDAAREISRRGFAEIRLATGHDPASFPAMPHILEVVGKAAPWGAA